MARRWQQQGLTGLNADAVAADPIGAATMFLANLVEGIDRPGLIEIERRAIVDVEVDMMMSGEISAAIEVLEPFVREASDRRLRSVPTARDPIEAAHRKALEADARRALRDFGDQVVNAVKPLSKPEPRPPEC